jgi:Protein of unknown function (DUF3631)
VSNYGALTLNDAVDFLRRFVVLSDVQADAVALWLAHTHAVDAAEATPYLVVTSPVKQCGKTRLIEVLQLTVREPIALANISDAALFRVVEEKTPTLLMDEVDALFKAREREELRGLINAGHRRGEPVWRVGGKHNTKPLPFATFCPKLLAGIGDCLPDTVLDRAIRIKLERKLPGELVERFRRVRVTPEGEGLRDRLADWLGPQAEALRAAEPPLPEELDDRAQDCWEPLLAIADLAAGGWPERARAAARALSGALDPAADDSVARLLLADLRAVVFRGETERISTADLLTALCADADGDRPWREWWWNEKEEKPTGGAAHRLGRLLHTFGISSKDIRFTEGRHARTLKGFERAWFEDAWRRYLPLSGPKSACPQ